MKLKDVARSLLIFFHMDVTKNLEYDRLTKAIMKRVIRHDSNCIDVGCHKGEMLDYILRLAPVGHHIGFEPIPELFRQLENKYRNKAVIYPFALSDKNGTSSFQFVKNAPAYSGIRKRRYDVGDPDIEEISVGLRTLDDLLVPPVRIDFIKIDVEGGEFGVLKGAKKTLENWRPFVIFECGLGASDYYDTESGQLYDFIIGTGLSVSLLKTFLAKGEPLARDSFMRCYDTNEEYYFIAHP